jgi:hypothetical protein
MQTLRCSKTSPRAHSIQPPSSSVDAPLPRPAEMSDPKMAEGTKDVPSQPKKELLLSVDPERANFLPTGSRSEHMIANLGEKRAAVKVRPPPFAHSSLLQVRCSDNGLFRVNPVHMLIDAGQCQNLVVTRLPGSSTHSPSFTRRSFRRGQGGQAGAHVPAGRREGDRRARRVQGGRAEARNVARADELRGARGRAVRRAARREEVSNTRE